MGFEWKKVHTILLIAVMLVGFGSGAGVHVYKAEAFMEKTNKRFSFQDLTQWEGRLVHLERIYGDFDFMPDGIQTEYIWIKGEICRIKLELGIKTECN
jgi:hypothetical protein